MVLMAIDHVRVYSGVPAGGPTAGIFFTRWVTHFCAPAFVVSRRHERVSVRPAARRHAARSRALSRHARPRAGGARADGHPRRVDVQPRLRALHAGRRHLDARLVHGAAGGAGLAADDGRRRIRPVGDLRAEPRRLPGRAGRCPSRRWRSSSTSAACSRSAPTGPPSRSSTRSSRGSA